MSKQLLAESSIAEVDVGNDGRPQATISINGVQITGLLDSGANVNCFGNGAEEKVAALGLKCKVINSMV